MSYSGFLHSWKILEISPSWKTPGNLTLLEIPPGFLRVLEKLLEF